MKYLILGAGPAGLTVANKLKLGGEKRLSGVGKRGNGRRALPFG